MTTPPAPQIIAATLRQLAEWGIDYCDPVSLQELATEVEEHDYTDSWSCPMCQEVTCDDGCPLESFRNHRETESP